MDEFDTLRFRISDWGPGDRKREVAKFWEETMPVVVEAVEQSFFKRGLRHPTLEETKTRTRIAMDLVKAMRWDFGFSKQRIRDQLPVALDAKIAGLALDLDLLGKRRAW